MEFVSIQVVFITVLLSVVIAVPTYEFVCPAGTELKGRKDWTDQQPVGTAFAGFTCCPVGYSSLQYLNENYFCCLTGSGASCMSNSCKCNSGDVKGGVIPTITKTSS